MYVCMHVFYVYMYVHNVCIYVCNLCMYVCMYVCMLYVNKLLNVAVDAIYFEATPL